LRYQAKLIEVDGKTNIQEKQLEDRRTQVAMLKERNADQKNKLTQIQSKIALQQEELNDKKQQKQIILLTN
jgi:two-component sensor histidine kinase